MQIPLDTIDLFNLFTVTTFTLIILLMLSNPYFGKLYLDINIYKIRKATLFSMILFIIFLIIRIFEQIIFF